MNVSRDEFHSRCAMNFTRFDVPVENSIKPMSFPDLMVDEQEKKNERKKDGQKIERERETQYSDKTITK